MIVHSYGFTEQFDTVPLSRYEERKESFYQIVEVICWRITTSKKWSNYLRRRFPVKTKNIDYENIRVLNRRFNGGNCQIGITLKDDTSDISSVSPYPSYYRFDNMRPHIAIYYNNRVISEFFVESPNELDNKICEISKYIPDFKSDVRNHKLDMLV
jgi:hypothetical protein